MALAKDALRRIVLVAHAMDAGFVELVGMAELDRMVAFRGAAMRGVGLRGQDLSGFDFRDGNFDDADVTGADLSRAFGLTPEMFRHAIFDRTTQWPPEMRAAMRKLCDGGQARGFCSPDTPPEWANDWGIDEYGPWVSFSVHVTASTPVTQRLRWVPPGRFMIGSPENEVGRFDDEGPPQEVTIADGFWMFDTACTEALWEAVTGKAPDPRRGAAFPVTNVSWDDAQDFIQRLNTTTPNLNLSLPSQAQWEYACRAGTTTPYNFGKRIKRARVRYNANAPVQTASLPPNGWGLHEMHGNVWEWCADQWHGSYKGVPRDGSVWSEREGAADRVIRGGPWYAGARYVRAACRSRAHPAYRDDILGFRCARVQSASEQRPVKRRAGRSKPSERSETAATTGPQRRGG